MTIDTERLDQSSTISVETILNQMPQFTPAQSQFSAVGEIQTSPTVSLGIGTGQPARRQHEPHARAHRRTARPARERIPRRRPEHDPVGGHRARRNDHGRCIGHVRRRRARRRRQLRAQGRLRRRVDERSDVAMSEAGDGEDTVFSALGRHELRRAATPTCCSASSGTSATSSYQKNRDFYTDGWYDPTNVAGTFFPSMPGLSDRRREPADAGGGGRALPAVRSRNGPCDHEPGDLLQPEWHGVYERRRPSAGLR